MAKGKQSLTVSNKEAFGRMNFLYQASMLMAKNNPLSAYYGRQCRSISKKTLLRMSPDFKRDLCKRCSLAQQPGMTADLEVIPQNQSKKTKTKHKDIDAKTNIQIKCRKCGFKRKFCVNPDYKFWLENPESIVEEIASNKKKEEKKKIAKDDTQKTVTISDASSESIT